MRTAWHCLVWNDHDHDEKTTARRLAPPHLFTRPGSLPLVESSAMNREFKTSPLIAVVGPTASGKSDLGIALAGRFNGEIVNCDSVQVYRGINIATAKVPPDERRGIP